MSVRPHTPTSSTVAMTSANTEYSWTYVAKQTGSAFALLDQTKAWRHSWSQGVVAGGGGMQIGAGFGIEDDMNYPAGTKLYFACSSAGQTMEVSYSRATS